MVVAATTIGECFLIQLKKLPLSVCHNYSNKRVASFFQRYCYVQAKNSDAIQWVAFKDFLFKFRYLACLP
jgi:hypothetical protein